MLGISRDLVEVNDGVEMIGRANPLIYRLAIGLGRRSRMIVLRADERHNRRANHLDPMRMRAHNHLLVGGENVSNQRVVFGSRMIAVPRKHAKIIHALEHNHGANTSRREHIMIETRQRIRTQAIEQQPVSADTSIQNSKLCSCRIRLQSPG